VTELHVAAGFGMTEIVQRLLDEAHDAAPIDSEGRTPLWRAAEHDHAEVMKLLARKDKVTLGLLIKAQQEPPVQRIFQVDGQNIMDYRGRTALHLAVQWSQNDDTNFVRSVLQSGVDIDAQDDDSDSTGRQVMGFFPQLGPEKIEHLTEYSGRRIW
jgi:ankyrin repeat protein